LKASAFTQLELISTHLDKNCTHLFRDANPNNTLIPTNFNLSNPLSRDQSLKTVTSLVSEWGSTTDKKTMFKNIIQIDFEMVGLKKTNKYDDFIHILGLIPSNTLRQNAISSFISSLSLDEKNIFYLTWAFRMTREGVRRLRYFSEHTLDKPGNYDKRYEIWGITEEFEYMFISSTSRLKRAANITGDSYDELIQLIEQIGFLTQKFRNKTNRMHRG
ncbi:MAG: hypothetical protein PSV35_06620, partial [bacterium]|nr:hypothetical protein [bacterium]